MPIVSLCGLLNKPSLNQASKHEGCEISHILGLCHPMAPLFSVIFCTFCTNVSKQINVLITSHFLNIFFSNFCCKTTRFTRLWKSPKRARCWRWTVTRSARVNPPFQTTFHRLGLAWCRRTRGGLQTLCVVLPSHPDTALSRPVNPTNADWKWTIHLQPAKLTLYSAKAIAMPHSRGAHSPVRGHPRGSKVVSLNSWGRVSY